MELSVNGFTVYDESKQDIFSVFNYTRDTVQDSHSGKVSFPGGRKDLMTLGRSESA